MKLEESLHGKIMCVNCRGVFTLEERAHSKKMCVSCRGVSTL